MVLLTLVAAWMLSRLNPPWHRPLDPDDPDTATLVMNVQNRFLELHNMVDRVPVLASQTWTIDQRELNSYLGRCCRCRWMKKGSGRFPIRRRRFLSRWLRFRRAR